MAVGRSSRVGREGSVHMALVNERLGPGRNVSEPSSVLAYELVQGKLVKWSSMVALDRNFCSVTGPRISNMAGWSSSTIGSLCVVQSHGWCCSYLLAVQFVLKYLRCHGDSASIKKRGPHTVASTALDVLKLIAQLRITPHVLIGHSFGGKVVLSMVEQAAKPFPRPVRVWVLYATPGKV
ncbi:hypothetical protein POUND7_007535 [Theobroma cacao]